MVTGPGSEAWDLAFIVEYPGSQAFIDMVRDPDYRANVVPHRTAAVADSRLLRLSPLEAGDSSATDWSKSPEGCHFSPRGPLAGSAHADPETQLRMLRPRSRRRQPRRAHLHLRVHLLLRLRRDAARRRPARTAAETSRFARSGRPPFSPSIQPLPSA